MPTVSIHSYRDNQIEVRCPYHPDWHDAAGLLGGTWQYKAKRWLFDGHHENLVRAALRVVFGTDGDEGLATVDVRIVVASITERRFALGREIVKPPKDGDPRLGEKVALIDREGVEAYLLEVVDVPKDLAMRHMEADVDSFTIVRDGVRKREWRRELKRLKRRVALIEAFLS